MNYDNLIKWVASLLLVAAWMALILLRVADTEEAKAFIVFIQSSLIAIGAHGLTVSGRVQGSPQGEAGAPAPTAFLPNGNPRPPLYVKGQEQKGSIVLLLVVICAILGLVLYAMLKGVM